MRSKTLLGFGLFLMGSCFAPAVDAAPRVENSPAILSTTQWDTLEIAVNVNSETPPVSCFALFLEYDPARLELVEARQGALFGAASASTYFSVDADTVGAEVLTDCVFGAGISVTPPGEIAVLRFVALAEGSWTVRYADAILRDVDRAVIAGVEADSTSILVGATASPPAVGLGLGLEARPNPSSGLTWIRTRSSGGTEPSLAVAKSGAGTRLEVYDIAGRRVRGLRWPGTPEGARWDGRDDQGRSVAAGTYFAVLRTPTGVLRTKLVRLD